MANNDQNDTPPQGDSSNDNQTQAPKTDDRAGPTDETATTALVPVKTDLQLRAEQATALAKEGEINAFLAISLTLASMNQSLTDIDGRPPRWVRIGRVGGLPGEGWKDRPVGKVVDAVTGAFLMAMGVVTELTLKALDLLRDIDGAKALVEVGAEMLETLSEDSVVKSIAYSVGARDPDLDFNEDGTPKTNAPAFDNPLRPVGKTMRTVKKVMRYIPGPEDIRGVAYELFNLLSFKHLDTPETLTIGGREYQVHLDLEKSGKVRLLSYARQKAIPVYKGKGLFELTKLPDIVYLGSRNIQVVTPPAPLVGLRSNWQSIEGTNETFDVYHFDYQNHQRIDPKKADTQEAGIQETGTQEAVPMIPDPDPDLREVRETLFNLKYTPAVEINETKLIAALKEFQKTNDLPQQEGQLDIHTIHRMMNLDYEKTTLCRAKEKEEASPA